MLPVHLVSNSSLARWHPSEARGSLPTSLLCMTLTGSPSLLPPSLQGKHWGWFSCKKTDSCHK